MLNPFPELLTFSFFAPTLLRVAVGLVFAYLAWHHFSARRACAGEIEMFVSRSLAGGLCTIYALIEALVALGLVIGLYTQVAALVGAVITLKILVLKRSFHQTAPLSRTAYALVCIICISLLVTGAGAYALDLPL